MKIKYYIKTILLLLINVFFVFSCTRQKNDKFIDEKTGEEQSIEIIRFDRILFEKPESNLETYLKDLQVKYPEVLAVDLDDKKNIEIISRFITDNYLRDAQNIVQRTYPNLTFLEKDLTKAFGKLKQQNKETQLPRRIYSLMLVPDDFSSGFEQRNYTNGDYAVIALDIYCFDAIMKCPYYKQFPQYMTQTLNQRYIAPDFMRMYLKNVTYQNTQDIQMNPDCTLLDCIIDEGKYSYIITQILPTYKEYEVLRYTQQQMDWCNENEKLIWGYIIQNQLLYEKDRSKYMSLIVEGPTSKPLSDSPSRVGYFIGYNIVKNFMDKENISWDSLMNITDSQLILKKSNYKPKK